MRRRGVLRRRSDEGLSLVELSVSMTIVSVLALAIGAVTISSFRALRTAQVRVATAADARVGMEAMSRTLRVAIQPTGETSAILDTSTYDKILFYALLSRAGVTQPLPTLVEYYRTGNCLMEAQTPARVLSTPDPDGSIYAWDTGRTARCLVRTTQVPTAAAPLFTYYTSAQLLSNGASSTPLTAPTGGLDLASRQSVRAVGVTLTVIDPANPTTAGATDQAQVTLGNVSLTTGGGA